MNDELTQPKRGRGRPRKYPSIDASAPKRGRGRPRKYPASEVAPAVVAPLPQTPPPATSPDMTQQIAEQPVPVIPAYPVQSSKTTKPSRSRRDWRHRHLMKRLLAKPVLRAGVGAAIVVVAIITVIAIATHHPKVAISTQTKDLIATVGRLTALPSGEQPTIYTVKDQAATTQAFLKDALNGDVVLVYAQASKAIVYRPSTQKIVAVGPTTGGTPAPAQSAPAQSAPADQPSTISVGLYNGSATAGLGGTYESLIPQAVSGLSIAIVDKAIRSDYPETIVVDLSGKQSAKAQEIANYLHAKLAPMPAGETVPQADILVIFGNNTKS